MAKPPRIRNKIAEYLRTSGETLSPIEISKRIGEHPPSVRRSLQVLAERGIVVRVQKGLYRHVSHAQKSQ